MKFVVIDVETANPQMSSICQIGVVGFDDGSKTFADCLYIDPEDYFDPLNQSILVNRQFDHMIEFATTCGQNPIQRFGLARGARIAVKDSARISTHRVQLFTDAAALSARSGKWVALAEIEAEC